MQQSGNEFLSEVVFTNRILAAFLTGTLLWHWRLVGAVFHTAPGGILWVVSLVLCGLMVGSAVGLFRTSAWGYYLTYALVPFATIFHGIALAPGVTGLLPEGTPRIVALLMVNLTFLTAAVTSHRRLRSLRSPGAVCAGAAAD